MPTWASCSCNSTQAFAIEASRSSATSRRRSPATCPSAASSARTSSGERLATSGSLPPWTHDASGNTPSAGSPSDAAAAASNAGRSITSATSERRRRSRRPPCRRLTLSRQRRFAGPPTSVRLGSSRNVGISRRGEPTTTSTAPVTSSVVRGTVSDPAVMTTPAR